MKELIIGASGFIGGHLRKRLPDALGTFAKTPPAIGMDRGGGLFRFNLTYDENLPDADIVYLCAGVNGNLACSLDPRGSYKVNVDGTIRVAEHYVSEGAFLVWISSTTVMWLGEHYGRQKRIAENYLRAMRNVGIIRAGRVLESNVGELCDLMVQMGRQRVRDLVVWNEDEDPYRH